MRYLSRIALVALSLCAACERRQQPLEEVAKTTFSKFQDAMFAQDATALRSLICRNAHRAITAICAKDVSSKKRLQVTKVTKDRYEYHVHVLDPNEGNRASRFVLCVENGRMRVDLLATVAHNHQTTQTRLAKPAFVPKKLAPDDIAKIRASQNAAPR